MYYNQPFMSDTTFKANWMLKNPAPVGDNREYARWRLQLQIAVQNNRHKREADRMARDVDVIAATKRHYDGRRDNGRPMQMVKPTVIIRASGRMAFSTSAVRAWPGSFSHKYMALEDRGDIVTIMPTDASTEHALNSMETQKILQVKKFVCAAGLRTGKARLYKEGNMLFFRKAEIA